MHGAILNVGRSAPPSWRQRYVWPPCPSGRFDNKEVETGITIHLVDGEYDHGRTIASKKDSRYKRESVEDIEEKVLPPSRNFISIH